MEEWLPCLPVIITQHPLRCCVHEHDSSLLAPAGREQMTSFVITIFVRANIFHLRYIMQLYLKHARVTLCNRIAIYREKFESSDCTAHARVMTFLKVITSQELVDILSV